MKQATREERRLAREAVEENFRLEREKRAVQYRKKAREELKKSAIKTFLWIVGIGLPLSLMIHYSNIDVAKGQAAIDNKLAIWKNYKNKNCKEIEKLYAMQMGSGKFQYVDNGTVYQCNNGLKYTLSDSAENGKAGLNSIPDVK